MRLMMLEAKVDVDFDDARAGRHIRLLQCALKCVDPPARGSTVYFGCRCVSMLTWTGQSQRKGVHCEYGCSNTGWIQSLAPLVLAWPLRCVEPGCVPRHHTQPRDAFLHSGSTVATIVALPNSFRAATLCRKKNLDAPSLEGLVQSEAEASA
eukprot:918062-Rhodomonas_salina.1